MTCPACARQIPNGIASCPACGFAFPRERLVDVDSLPATVDLPSESDNFGLAGFRQFSTVVSGFVPGAKIGDRYRMFTVTACFFQAFEANGKTAATT